MRELINPNLSNGEWESILSLATIFSQTPLTAEFADKGKEFPLLLNIFLEDEWQVKALNLLTELAAKEKFLPSGEYYGEALKGLLGIVVRLGERNQNLLMLFYMAYHLGFYEFSEVKLNEVGDGFKGSLIDNVDPKVCPCPGSPLTYPVRLKNYVAGQICFHKDEIAKQISENIAAEAPVVKRRP